MKLRSTKFPLLITAIAAVASFLAACWTSAESGQDLQRRVTAVEQGETRQRQELEKQLADARAKVQELEGVLDKATKVVKRASADTGAQVDSLQQQVQQLTGQIEEMRNEAQRQQTQFNEQQAAVDKQLKLIRRHVGIEAAVDESEIPADADAHFAAAELAFTGRQFARARALYNTFMERYRSDTRLDDALYKVGMSYLAEDRPATALGELRRVITHHPQGDVADDALLGMSDAFYRLHACTDSRSALETLIRAHPRSELVAQARRKLREIQHPPRGYCTS